MTAHPKPGTVLTGGEMLDDLLARARANFDAMTVEERAALLKAQKESWVRAEMAFGDEGTRPLLPMISVPRGPAVADPEAFDDCLACDSPSLEPPASDVAGWRPTLKECRDWLDYALHEEWTPDSMALACFALDRASAMLAAAPPVSEGKG